MDDSKCWWCRQRPAEKSTEFPMYRRLRGSTKEIPYGKEITIPHQYVTVPIPDCTPCLQALEEAARTYKPWGRIGMGVIGRLLAKRRLAQSGTAAYRAGLEYPAVLEKKKLGFQAGVSPKEMMRPVKADKFFGGWPRLFERAYSTEV